MNVNKIVEECNPFELPSISLSQKLKLTSSAGIYFVLHEDRVLYIGKSDCIKSRWINHGQLKQLRKIDGIVRISCIEYPVETTIDRVAIDLMESAFIDKFKPPLNKKTGFGFFGFDIDKHLADYCLRYQTGNPLSKQADTGNLAFQWNSGGNMEAKLDRISLIDLMGRYEIKKSALYDRLNALKIQPEKTLKGSYVNGKQLTLLDELNDFLKKGGKIAEFIGKHIDSQPITPNSRLPQPFSPFAQLVRDIAAALRPDKDPIAPLVSLETAAERNWLLTSHQVKALIGVYPRGETYTRGSFTFIKSGKIGASFAWKVSRLM